VGYTGQHEPIFNLPAAVQKLIYPKCYTPSKELFELTTVSADHQHIISLNFSSSDICFMYGLQLVVKQTQKEFSPSHKK
jgi:hypothetical protein